MVNYRKKLRMEGDIRRKGKVEKIMEFVKRMKKIQEETETTLKRCKRTWKDRQIKKKRNRRMEEEG